MFAHSLAGRGRFETVLDRGIQVLLGVLLLSGLGSGYRAIRPPTLEVKRVHGEPDRLRIRLEHSGRGVVEVRVELVERGGTRSLGSRRILGNRFPVFNPFAVRADFRIDLPRDRSSDAIARVTAIPSTQWLWQPPSVVRELPLGG